MSNAMQADSFSMRSHNVPTFFLVEVVQYDVCNLFNEIRTEKSKNRKFIATLMAKTDIFLTSRMVRILTSVFLLIFLVSTLKF